jgi:S-(hydroxymethyl)glutathione dehydrogenase/alcohol dehydrogenase
LAPKLYSSDHTFLVQTITVDPPQAGEVRVRNVAAGVCASDAHFLWNQETDLKLDFDGLPVVLGHEGSAIVESVGAGVEGVSVGDHVIPLFIPNCDRCALCANPRTNQCADANFATLLRARDGSTRLRIDGRPLLSLCGTNTFGEYAVLRESQICKVFDALFMSHSKTPPL